MNLPHANDDHHEPTWSLRRRLLLLLFSVIVVATLVQAWISYRTVLAAADVMFDYQMLQMASALRSSQGPALIGSASTDEDVEDFAFVVNIHDSKGRLVFANAPVSLPTSLPTGYANTYVGRERYRIYTNAGADTRVQVAQELESRSEIAAELALRSLWPMVALSGAILLSVYLVITQALKPLTRLREQIMRRRPDGPGALSQVDLPDEIHPFVAEINALMTRMQEAYEAQRRFVSDAAHELRSPLAAVQLQGEIVRRAVNQEQREAALARQREGIARATRLVEQLLVMARHDDTAADAKGELVPLVDVVRQALDEIDVLARRRRIDIVVDLGESACVAVPADVLRSVAHNLIDNAVKYAPEGGSVHIHAEHGIGPLRFWVEDSGAGIALEERARVMDRFYRIPGSQAYGSGLGLSIVDRALRAVGGRLELGDSHALGGLCATCFIPSSSLPSATKLPADRRA